MHPPGFEPTISAGERPQTYDLDRAATGTGRRSPLETTNSATPYRFNTQLSRMVQSNPENIGNSYKNGAKEHMRHVVPRLATPFLTLEMHN